MKQKILIIILTFALIPIILVACSSGSTPSNSVTDANETTTEELTQFEYEEQEDVYGNSVDSTETTTNETTKAESSTKTSSKKDSKTTTTTQSTSKVTTTKSTSESTTKSKNSAQQKNEGAHEWG